MSQLTDQNKEDQEQLKLLVIGHYIVAGIQALFSLFPLIHVFIGLSAIFSPENFCPHRENCMPPFFGWMFVGAGVMVILIGMSLAVMMLINGRFIKQRKHRVAAIAMAGVSCMLVPFGTVLGVFTILILVRPSVKELFVRSL